MTILLATNSPLGIPNAPENTTAGNFDSNNVSRCFHVTKHYAGVGGWKSHTPLVAASGDITWLHFKIKFSTAETASGGNYSAGWRLLGADGKIMTHFQYIGNTGYYHIVYADSTTNGAGISWPFDHTNVHDVDIKLDHTGTNFVVTTYIDQTQAWSTTGADTGGRSKLGGIQWEVYNNTGNDIYVSELIVADEDTRNFKLSPIPLLANGDNTAWAGGITELTDETYYKGATSGTTGQKQTMTLNTYGGVASTALKGVAFMAYGSVRGVTVGDVRPVMRIVNVDYFGSAFGMSAGNEGKCVFVATDPSSGVDWDTADFGVSDYEFGIDSTA